MSRRVPCLWSLALWTACTSAATDTTPETGDTGAGDTGDSADIEPATATWMADELPAGADDVPLRELLLPGTFNSASYACAVENGMSPDAPDIVKLLWGSLDPDVEGDAFTRERIVGWAKAQDQSVTRQLVDGIRALDLNFTARDGELLTWHSVYGEPLADVLGDIVAFVTEHPDEIVVLTFTPTIDEADRGLFADALSAPHDGGLSICDLLFTGDTPSAQATLAQVRASGRPLIWRPSDDLTALLDTRGGCPAAPFEIEGHGAESITTEGVIAKLDATVANRLPDVFLYNDFFFYLGTSSDGQQASFIAEYPSMADAMDDLGFLGDFPGDLIDQFDTDAKMNLFYGGFYDRTNLVEAVIERTRTRQAD